MCMYNMLRLPLLLLRLIGKEYNLLWSRIKAGTFLLLKKFCKLCFLRSFTKTLGSIRYYLSNYAASHARIMEVLQEQIWNFAIVLVASVVFHSAQCELIYSTT